MNSEPEAARMNSIDQSKNPEHDEVGRPASDDRNHAALAQRISTATLSDPYEVLARFKAGDVEALEVEMLARWAGYRTTFNQKVSLIRSAIITLRSFVDQVFTLPSVSVHEQSKTSSSIVYINASVLDELELFGLINTDHILCRYSFNESGKVFVLYMYEKYVENY